MHSSRKTPIPRPGNIRLASRPVHELCWASHFLPPPRLTLLQTAGVCSATPTVNHPGIAMKKFIAFAAASALLWLATTVATAAAAGEWFTCKDGLKVQNQVTCSMHGGVLIETIKSTPIKSKPIDASKGLAPPQTATATKSKTKSSSTSTSTRKKVATRSSGPTAKCNDGALY